MTKPYIAQLPPRRFINKFLARSTRPTAQLRGEFRSAFDEMSDQYGAPHQPYQTLAKCVEDKDLCPKYTIKLLGKENIIDDNAHATASSAAVFLTEDLPCIGQRDCHWSFQRATIVCEKGHRDPFTNNNKDGVNRLTTMASKAFSWQQRTHHFMVLIYGATARLACWDRAGAVVTEAFEYKRSAYLGEFFWRFARLDPEDQGTDPTAQIVRYKSLEYDLIESIIANQPPGTSDYAYQSFLKSLEDGSRPWWKLEVAPEKQTQTQEQPQRGKKRRATTSHQAGSRKRPRRGAAAASNTHSDEIEEEISEEEDDRDRIRYFLVGKPHFESQSLPGRGTRGYIAIDISNETLVFLKDAWRTDQQSSEREGSVLAQLNAEGVTGVPTLAVHGDVAGQQTRLRECWTEREGAPPTYHHYRLVVEEVCRPLQDFHDGQELVSIITECISVHEQAMTKTGLMHCDISRGNVLIYERPTERGELLRSGMLCDWEFARPVVVINAEKAAPHNAGGDGTWAYRSVRTTDEPKTPRTVPDELESFFHLLLDMATKYLPTNVLRIRRQFTEDFFHGCGEHPDKTSRVTCTRTKRDVMHTGELCYGPWHIRFFTQPNHTALHPIEDVLNHILAWLSARYSVTMHQAWKKRSRYTRSLVRPPDAVLNLEQPELAARVKLAESLSTHGPMRMLLLLHLALPWPKNDKIDPESRVARPYVKPQESSLRLSTGDAQDGEERDKAAGSSVIFLRFAKRAEA